MSPPEDPRMGLGWEANPIRGLCGSHTGGGRVRAHEPLPLVHRWRTKQNLDYCFLMMYAQSKGIYYVQVSTETLPCPPETWTLAGAGGKPCRTTPLCPC